MPGKGPKGGNSLPPGGQCKSYRVKARLPEAQFGGVYTAAAAEGELESRFGLSLDQTMRSRIPADLSRPQSSGCNERATYVRRSSSMLKHRIAYAGEAGQSAHLYGDGVSRIPTFTCNGSSSQNHLDQLRYKTW
jgi:hypothetical protein